MQRLLTLARRSVGKILLLARGIALRWGRRINLAGRVLWGPIDRVRNPLAPVLVVGLDDQTPRAAAEFGSSLFVGGERFATASDVTWLDHTSFAVCYLLTSSVAVFNVETSGDSPACTLLCEVRDPDVLGNPEAIESLSGGKLIAMTDSVTGRLSLVRVGSGGGHGLELVSSVSAPSDRNVHGLAVSPDERFLAYTAIDEPGGLRVAEVLGGDRMELVDVVANVHAPLKPKGVHFTPDGRHLVVAYGANASSNRRRVKRGFLEVCEFNPSTGVIGNAISRSPRSLRLSVPEWLSVDRAGKEVIVCDQVRERVSTYEFNPDSGVIGDAVRRISWAAGGLSFPHGCGISPDERWIAIANYGDGSVRLFDMTGG
jgi:hypothetical protein